MRCAVAVGVEENTAAIIRSRLKTRLFTLYSALAGLIASAAWKPITLCVPSQNGLLDEAPHRQSAIRGLSTVILFPSVSKRSTAPSMMYGPFFDGRIVTSAILPLPIFLLV